MASKSGTGKNIRSEPSDAAPDKDRLIAELKDRIHFLERELQSQSGAHTTSSVDCERVENALRDNEKFLNNIFNCIQDGLSVMSKDLTVIRHNPTIEKWHGKDVIGKSVTGSSMAAMRRARIARASGRCAKGPCSGRSCGT